MAGGPRRWVGALGRRIALVLDRHKRRNERGIVLMFHEVHDNDDDFDREFRAGCTTAFLDAIVGRLVRDRWDIIRLDEAMSRLERDDSTRRFAAVTFDDGYRNTLTAALPILERYGVPFTVYVPTGAITGDLPSWWLGLRAVFQRHDAVTIAPMEKTYQCRDGAAKAAACAEVRRWVHQDYRRPAALAETFRTYGVSLAELNGRYFMDEAELKTLARHPLASIGAHSESHPALALLGCDEARQEMQDNRSYLEALLDCQVRHFAYPYGGPAAFGDRDVALAAEIGFKTAVAGNVGAVSIAHRKTPHRIPRMEFAGSAGQLEYCLGVLRTLRPAQ